MQSNLFNLMNVATEIAVLGYVANGCHGMDTDLQGAWRTAALFKRRRSCGWLSAGQHPPSRGLTAAAIDSSDRAGKDHKSFTWGHVLGAICRLNIAMGA